MSLGILRSDWSGESHFALTPGAPCFLERAWQVGGMGIPCTPTRKTRGAAEDAAALAAMQGSPLEADELRLLKRAVPQEVCWSRKLILSMCLATLHLSRGEVRKAARACAEGQVGYAGLAALAAKHGAASLPAPLLSFERLCEQVLKTMEPPIAAHGAPVRQLLRVVRKWPRPRRSSPQVTISALDAVITAGRSAPGPALEARVIHQLARMLSARVLLHIGPEGIVDCEPQDVHTLSSWTMLTLRREEALRARRVRRRPEFWRPEQRRPRGLLSLPVGSSRACLARESAFGDKEVEATRTVLAFLAERTAAKRVTAPAPERPSRSAPQGNPSGLVGESPAWRRVLNEVWKFGPTDGPILIRGETGTGKELVARAIHQNSRRTARMLIAVNCGALGGETLLSELFGHVRGAFTGATQSSEGLVRAAHGGTLFLDEVGDMSPAMQIALLRVLEEKRVRPVGGLREQPADVRIVSATHKDLSGLVRAGLFREDLFHRLSMFEIQIPPLRDRLDDLPALTASLLESFGAPSDLDPGVLPILANHRWPGNVRELRNVLQAASLLSTGPGLEASVVRQILDGRRTRQPVLRGRLRPRTARLLRLLDRRWRSAPELADLLGVSTRTMNRDLAELLDCELAECVGNGRARVYRTSATACRDLSGTGPA